MLSVGVDLLEIPRIERAMKNPRFCRRILGDKEYDQLAQRGFPAASVAVSFCAKEAFSKALGTGVRGFLLKEVQLLRDELGKPYLHLEGAALEAARQAGLAFSVGATHTACYASVTVIGEKSCSKITVQKRCGKSAHGGNAAILTDPADMLGAEMQRKLLSSVTMIASLRKEHPSNETIRKRRHAGAGRKSRAGGNRVFRSDGERGGGRGAAAAGKGSRCAYCHSVRKGQ
ncbi:holo-ACP synthase [Faecalispora anaeroviscerum]|uniref:holo-ACP synthase n=1 Tax=Faecalispora anaeroviscerum TaxID=2991836 RepID=UPI0024B88AD7|nr:holo-ACP synthase [Faecalispora anaeroviscerum]